MYLHVGNKYLNVNINVLPTYPPTGLSLVFPNKINLTIIIYLFDNKTGSTLCVLGTRYSYNTFETATNLPTISFQWYLYNYVILS